MSENLPGLKLLMKMADWKKLLIVRRRGLFSPDKRRCIECHLFGVAKQDIYDPSGFAHPLKQGVTDFFSGTENHLTKHSCILACIHTCLLKDFYTGKHDYFHTCTHTHLHIWMVAYLHTWKLVNLLTWKLANLHTSQGISVHIEAHFNSNLLKFNIGKLNLEIIQQLVVSRPSRLHIFTSRG